MILSRVFSALCVVGVAAAGTIIACGGDDSNKMADAKVYMDGKVYMDAAAATGIGFLCPMGPSQCPASDPVCIKVSIGGMMGTTGWCTKSCGSGGSAMPPTGGDTICKMSETSSGTPGCVLNGGSGSGGGSSYNWYCGVVCGSTYGTCPAGLNCSGSAGGPGVCY